MTVVLAVSLTLAAVGYRTRVALAPAAPLYLYHWALFNSWGKVNHGKIPIVVALFVLAVAPSAARLSVDAWRARRAGLASPGDVHDRLAGWALRVVGVIIVVSYAFSVVAKLTNSGIAWVGEPVLLTSMRTGDSALHVFLVDRPWLLVVMQALTLLVEAAAVLVFLGGWVRNVLLAALAGFHIGSYVLLETEFFGFLVGYLVFFRLERIPQWLRALGTDMRDAPAAVSGDGRSGAGGERPRYTEPPR